MRPVIITAFTILIANVLCSSPGPDPSARKGTRPTYKVIRLNQGRPVITRAMFEAVGAGRDGENINGPSVIRVPRWLKDSGRVADPKANYYLYFAHHGGRYIRLAWSETLTGEWTLYQIGKDIKEGQRGVLDLGADGKIAVKPKPIGKHIASPHVLVDDVNKRIVMYFHGPSGGQKTFGATSADGLNFNLPIEGGQPGHGVRETPLGTSYFRTFNFRGQAYAFANNATLYKAPDGAIDTEDAALSPCDINGTNTPWTKFPAQDTQTEGPIQETHNGTEDGDGDALEKPTNPRHSGVRFSSANPDELHVFYSRKGDSPERIQMQKVDLSSGDWTQWTASWPPEEILRPELEWEGINNPADISSGGNAIKVRQLRDPYIFEDTDRRIYLFYTGAGEEAIGVAELIEIDTPILHETPTN